VESFTEGMATWKGDGLLLASSCAWALYTILARRWAVTAWPATVGIALLAALMYLPIYAWFLPKGLSTVSWVTIATQALYQGVLAVVVAMLLYMKAIAALGPQRMGALLALVPAVSGCAASAVLGEHLSIWSLAGIVLVSSGAFLSNRDPRIMLKEGKPCLT
jgi:drug/metabolite transporter (DMT)-like permease